jgi:predicted PurR-regulated permease PerM
MGILFGILGLFLADPLLAMTKVWLTRRAQIADRKQDVAAVADGA